MKKQYVATRKTFDVHDLRFYIDELRIGDTQVSPPRLAVHSLKKVNESLTNGCCISKYVSRMPRGCFTPLHSKKDFDTIERVLMEESRQYGVKFELDQELTDEIAEELGKTYFMYYKISTLHEELVATT